MGIHDYFTQKKKITDKHKFKRVILYIQNPETIYNDNSSAAKLAQLLLRMSLTANLERLFKEAFPRDVLNRSAKMIKKTLVLSKCDKISLLCRLYKAIKKTANR
jgi:hypothetical protein